MKRAELSELDYCKAFGEISKDGFGRAMKIANGAVLAHSGYQHYTSLGSFKKMFDSRTMWLSRQDNRSLNGWNEFGKYGFPYEWKRTYIGCFSYGRSESAAMWKMYCHPNRDALRVLISPKGIKVLNEELKGAKSLRVYPIIEEGDAFKRGRCRVRVGAAGLNDVRVR